MGIGRIMSWSMWIEIPVFSGTLLGWTVPSFWWCHIAFILCFLCLSLSLSVCLSVCLSLPLSPPPSLSLSSSLPPPPPHTHTKCTVFFPLACSCQVLHLYLTRKSTFNICIFMHYWNSELHLSYFAEFVCCEVLDSNTFFFFFFLLLKMYFSLPQLFVFLFEVLSVAVFVIRDRFVKRSTCIILSLFTSLYLTHKHTRACMCVWECVRACVRACVCVCEVLLFHSSRLEFLRHGISTSSAS